MKTYQLNKLWKRLIFSLIPAVVLFGGVEIFLRTAGFEFDTRFDQHPIFVDTGNGGRVRTHKTLIDSTIFDYAFCVDQEFAKRKSQGTLRIALVGGSSTVLLSRATPLAERLRTHFNKPVEVINCGFAGTDCRRALQSAREAMAFSPDVLIVYSGHNEFISITNPATRLTSKGQPAQHHWGTDIRLVQFVEKSYARYVHPSHDWMELNGRIYTLDEKEFFYRNFEKNLIEIVELAKQHRVKVVLSTLPFNYAVHPTAADGYNDFAQVRDLSKPKLLRELDRQPENSFLEYAIGVDAIRGGKVTDAKKWFDLAFLHDLRPQVADARINEIVRQVAMEYGVTLADVSRAIREQSAENRLPDFLLFFDHCHLNKRGQQIQLDIFADAVINLLSSR